MSLCLFYHVTFFWPIKFWAAAGLHTSPDGSQGSILMKISGSQNRLKGNLAGNSFWIGLKPCKMKIYRDVYNRPQWSWYLRPGHPFSSGQIPFLDDWIISWIHQLNHQSTGFLEGAVGLTTCHKLLKPWCYDLHALGYKSCTCNYGFHSFDTLPLLCQLQPHL